MGSKTRAARVIHDQQGHNLEIIQRDDNNPLPPIEALERLHQFRPDLVDHAIRMAEDEAKDRREKESKVLKYTQRDNLLSQIFAFIICIFAVGTAGWLGYIGREYAAFAVCGVPVAIIVSSFLKRVRH